VAFFFLFNVKFHSLGTMNYLFNSIVASFCFLVVKNYL
jgi:hypothetical protein